LDVAATAWGFMRRRGHGGGMGDVEMRDASIRRKEATSRAGAVRDGARDAVVAQVLLD